MREKTPKAIVTFATTSDAMAMESAARDHGIPGRIIPVPSQIDAGCGLAWCVDEARRDELTRALALHDIAHEALFSVSLY